MSYGVSLVVDVVSILQIPLPLFRVTPPMIYGNSEADPDKTKANHEIVAACTLVAGPGNVRMYVAIFVSVSTKNEEV